MVPSNLGLTSAVLAAMATLQPSLANLIAIALPIPRLAPVMNAVRPASFLHQDKSFLPHICVPNCI